MGQTWAQYDLKEIDPRSGSRINKKNADGWFRMDLRKGWIERAEILFLKPKPAPKNGSSLNVPQLRARSWVGDA